MTLISPPLPFIRGTTRLRRAISVSCNGALVASVLLASPSLSLSLFPRFSRSENGQREGNEGKLKSVSLGSRDARLVIAIVFEDRRPFPSRKEYLRRGWLEGTEAIKNAAADFHREQTREGTVQFTVHYIFNGSFRSTSHFPRLPNIN